MQKSLSRRQGRFGRSVDAVSPVFFLPKEMLRTTRQAVRSLGVVFAHRSCCLSRMFRAGNIVGIKLGRTQLENTAPFIREVACSLMESSAQACVCDTSDMHISRERNGIHRAAELNSVTKSRGALPVMMLDGVMGQHERTRSLDKRIEQGVHLAGDIHHMSGIVSIVCVTSDKLAGLSGALVNLGQGLASKRGKIIQRSMNAPKVHPDKCYKCKRCIRECPVGAIHLTANAIRIDAKTCIRCGRCVETAHYGGITFDWNASPSHYQQALVSYCASLSAVLEGRLICVNLLFAKEGRERKNRFKGAFVSRDPVAADAAALKAFEHFGLIDEDASALAREMLALGDEKDVGSIKHRLIRIAY